MKQKIKRVAENAGGITIGEAWEEFINEKLACNITKYTYVNYTNTYKELFPDENIPASTVEQSDWYRWINHYKARGVKDTTVIAHMRFIKVFMLWCMDIDRNYIKPFKMPNIRTQEETMRLFTDEELDALLIKPRRGDTFVVWRTYAMVNWILGTGNRAGTVVDVRISDINFARKEIVLRHTKNKKAQIIPLSSSLSTVIKEYIRMWRADSGIDAYLFPSIGDEKLTVTALYRAFVDYATKRGCTNHTIHGLRHNFAKGWVKNNGNMFALQKILGHSTLDMTKRYVKLFSDDIKEDYDKFSPLDTIKRNSSRTQRINREEDF